MYEVRLKKFLLQKFFLTKILEQLKELNDCGFTVC
jgi:hypothetical protein